MLTGYYWVSLSTRSNWSILARTIDSAAGCLKRESSNELHRLKVRLEEELEEPSAEVSSVNLLFEKLPSQTLDQIELRAAALTLHGFYNGVEAVFLIIGKRYDNHVANGLRRHRQLLNQMKRQTDERKAIIGQREYDILLQYLGFHQMVRHTYARTLDRDRFRDIAGELPQAHIRVDQCIRRFVTGALTNEN